MIKNKKLQFIVPEASEELFEAIPNNIERYLDGNFADILGSKIYVSETDINFDYEKLKKINITQRNKSSVDGLNSFRVYCAIPDLPKNYATYHGIWIKLCHDECLNYARGRWLKSTKSEEELKKDIERHFFGAGRTGYRDDNAIGRLWWTGAIIMSLQQKNKDTSIDFCRKVCSLFKFQQRRFDTIERARIFNQQKLAEGIIEYFNKGNLSGERDTREFMKNVNRNASGLLIGGLNHNELEDFFHKCVG
jgi:hypothetical protein